MCNRFFLFVGVFLLCIGDTEAQAPENIYVGLYGRQENNIYRYYGGNTLGTYYSTRVTQGYSAGVFAHSSINYLFNLGIGFGISEAKYSPDIAKGNTKLYLAQLRLWHLNIVGELKLSPNEKAQPVLIAGGQWMFRESGRELFSAGNIEEYSWPQSRFMPQIGFGYNFAFKKKWLIKPNMGIRLSMKNEVGYDYTANQIFFGASIIYRVKNW